MSNMQNKTDLDSLILLDASLNLRLAAGRSDVGSAHVNLLLDDTAVDQLVNSHTNGGLGHVENNSSSAVVMLEGHTLVDGRVNFDINVVSSLQLTQNLALASAVQFAKRIIGHASSNSKQSCTNLEGTQESGGWASSLGLEGLLEQSSGGRAITEAVRHLC
jgi:hypothetical protein